MDLIHRLLQRHRPYDSLTLGYLLIVLIFLAISPQPPSASLRIAGVHGAAILGVLLLARFAERSPVLRGLHDFYPMLLFIVLFSEFTQLSTALFPYWIEPLLIRFDLWMFGGPPLRWVAARFSPAAVEFFAVAYLSYYLIIPGTLLLVYRKNYPHELSEAASRICLTMYTCYLLFMLIPARGPHHALPNADPILIKGGFFTDLIHEIQKTESVQGAAFPSSHVAVAWVALFILRRHYKKTSWPLGFLVAALTLSVVAMGYHFSLDAAGGTALALVLNAAMKKSPSLFRSRGSRLDRDPGHFFSGPSSL